MTLTPSAVEAALAQVSVEFLQQYQNTKTIWDKLGSLPVKKTIHANQRYVEVPMIVSNGEVLTWDEYNDLGGSEAITIPARLKVKGIDWKINLKRGAYESAVQEGTSEYLELQRLILDNMGAKDKKLDTLCTTGYTAASDRDYDPDFVAPLSLSSTGTASDPQDMCDSAGTANNYGTVNFSGSGVTANAIENSILTDIITFQGKVDDYSDGTLLKFDGTDQFALFMNPQALTRIEKSKVYNGSDYESMTYGEVLDSLNVVRYPTHRLTWGGAVDDTTTYILMPNLMDNIYFKWINGKEFKTDPWDTSYTNATLRAHGKFITCAKPYSFDAGSTIEKAVIRSTITPIGS
jgi:hypothetical protein